MSQLSHILPDYMLVFSVPVLTHDPLFERFDNLDQLKVSATNHPILYYSPYNIYLKKLSLNHPLI